MGLARQREPGGPGPVSSSGSASLLTARQGQKAQPRDENKNAGVQKVNGSNSDHSRIWPGNRRSGIIFE